MLRHPCRQGQAWLVVRASRLRGKPRRPHHKPLSPGDRQAQDDPAGGDPLRQADFRAPVPPFLENDRCFDKPATDAPQAIKDFLLDGIAPRQESVEIELSKPGNTVTAKGTAVIARREP